MTKSVILIAGKAQHGKDTTAQYLDEMFKEDGYSSKIIHYADLLKFYCEKYFGWDGKKDEKGRELLQKVGTDMIRAKDPDFWVNQVLRLLEVVDEWEYIIIPDVRFPNEVDYILRDYDGYFIKVFRPNFDNGLTEEQKKHPSETALDNREPLYTILNNGTLEDLKTKTETLYKRIIGARNI